MNSGSEQLVDIQYERRGYKKLTKGHVDRIYYKLDYRGKIIFDSVVFVEIKHGLDRLKPDQIMMRRLLMGLGIKYKLKYLKDYRKNSRTSVTVSLSTAQSLKNLRVYPRETFENIVTRLMKEVGA